MRKKQTNNNQQMSREELTRTQVLNLSDFERVTKYEKSISKKPAIFLAVLGVICIIAGLSYTPIMNIVIDKITPEPPKIAKKVTDSKPLTETKADTLACRYNSIDETSGTELIVDLNLTFYNETLDYCTKTMNYVTILGKENLGQKAINYHYPIFMSLEEIEIPGYTIKTTLLNNGFETKTTFDLKNINTELLTDYHKMYPVTNVDFAYGETKDEAIERATSYGYICE